MKDIQEVKTKIDNKPKWLINIENLYSLYSNKNLIEENACKVVFDKDLEPLINTLEIGLKKNYIYNFEKIYKEKTYGNDTNNIIVCYSGGKDSVATALKYKELGYNVYLYHVRGINKSYPDEHIRAYDVANYLNLPLYIENVSLKGKNTYLEHPMKNQLVCSLALNYALKSNLGTHIAFGDFIEDTVNEGLFDRNWSDTHEMWCEYEQYIKTFIPTFKLEIPFNNYLETIDIVSKDIVLLSKIQSCITPYRFKNKLHNLNQDKYSVDLLDNRCGSCWKCCVEYIYLVDNKLICINKDFYIHCLDILKKKMSEEKPFLPKPKDYMEVYKAYIPYGFEKSYLNKSIIKNKNSLNKN